MWLQSGGVQATGMQEAAGEADPEGLPREKWQSLLLGAGGPSWVLTEAWWAPVVPVPRSWTGEAEGTSQGPENAAQVMEAGSGL